jgi:hypothetical protein
MADNLTADECCSSGLADDTVGGLTGGRACSGAELHRFIMSG